MEKLTIAGRPVGPGEPPRPTRLPLTDLGGAWVLPGFVDLHVHGGGGT